MERIKVLYTWDFDPETGECVCVDKEIIKDNIKKKGKKKEESLDEPPKITLDANKLVFNLSALDKLKAKPGDKIDIKYSVSDNIILPLIGVSSSFGTPDSGNKLNKSNGIVCKGKANIELGKHGTTFTLEPFSVEGQFILKGERTVEEVPIVEDKNIQLPDASLEIPPDDDNDEEIDIDALLSDSGISFKF